MKLEIGDIVFEVTDDQADELRRQLGVTTGCNSAFLTTAEVAARFGFSPEYVRDHAAELGGEKLTEGPKAQWRFDPAKLKRPESTLSVKVDRRRSSHGRSRNSAALLEVRGERPN